MVERDEIVAINGDSILDNEGGPEAFQQVKIIYSGICLACNFVANVLK